MGAFMPKLLSLRDRDRDGGNGEFSLREVLGYLIGRKTLG